MRYKLLSAEDCCAYYNINFSFLELLHEHNLIEFVHINEQRYLHLDTLKSFEKLMHMHYDLDINVEGIEVINNLLLHVSTLHQQIGHLKSKLNIYEEDL